MPPTLPGLLCASLCVLCVSAVNPHPSHSPLSPPMICWTKCPPRIPSRTRSVSERQVPECIIVIFGANGDLTKRKLLPALYRLAFDRRLSAGFAIVGISRTPLSDDAFREKMRAAVEQFSETPSSTPTSGRPSRAALLRLRRYWRRRPLPAPRRKARLHRSRAPHRRQRPFLSLHAAQPVRPRRPRHRRRRHGEGKWLAPPGGGKAPSATISPAPRIERQPAPGLRRNRRLPHRSLPGEGDRPEHPGLSLRQRHSSNALEPGAT